VHRGFHRDNDIDLASCRIFPEVNHDQLLTFEINIDIFGRSAFRSCIFNCTHNGKSKIKVKEVNAWMQEKPGNSGLFRYAAG